MEHIMKKALLVLAAGTAFLSVPALAQDADTSFTGPRVGVLLGYDVTKAGSSVDDDANFDNDQSIDVALGGLVVGAEASISDSTAKTEFDEGDFEGFGIGNVKANRDLYVGARVGAAVTPTTLLYAKGGYTNAKFDVNSSDGTTELSQDIDTDGYRLGGGVEQKFGTNTYAKVEYAYSNYKKGEVDFNGELADTDRFDLDLDRHQVVASVGLRF
jgi:outer membrane immunogenic protein